MVRDSIDTLADNSAGLASEQTKENSQSAIGTWTYFYSVIHILSY